MIKTGYKTCKAVIFDMDGVLIDSEPRYNISDGRLLKSFGIEINEQIINRLTGSSYRTYPALVRSLKPDIDKSDEELTRLYAESLLSAVKEVEGLLPGVDAWIERFRSMGLKLAIGSSSRDVLVEYIVGRFGLKMDTIVTGTDVMKGKPDPGIFLMCAERLDAEPDECLVIEDSENGVKAAVNAIMRCAAFTGTRRHNFDLSPADIEIDAYDDLNWEKLQRIL